MEIYKIKDDFSNIPKINFSFSLCLGYFDGVHIAHQRLINEAKVFSDNKIGIITFSNSVKGRMNLTSLESRLNLFKALGVDYVFVLPFNNKIKKLTPNQFNQLFLNQLNISTIFVGKDFTYGKNKLGNVEYLKRHYKVHVVKFLKKNNKKISSIDIVNFIKNGNILKANEYLGRPYQVHGKVITGYKKGRELNFPTANIRILDNYVVPKFGVYKVIVYVFGIPYIGIANVGIHPTVNELKVPLIEAHIRNFSGDIYGKEIFVEFIDFIRPEKKFRNEKELIRQIKKDVSTLNNLQ